MNYAAAVSEIRRFFAQEWNDLTPVAYDDVAFDIPNNTTWLRLNISHNAGFQASTGSPGSNKYRRIGIVTVNIFQPEGQGSKDARAKADRVIEILQRPRTNGIAYYNVTPKEIGNDLKGWYHIKVTAEFEYDTIA